LGYLALGLLLTLVGGLVVLVVVSGGGGWETMHDYGRWTIDADGRTIRTERVGLLGCDPEHRAMIVESTGSEWLLRFETRSTGELCDALACESGGLYGCGAVMRLERAVPAGVSVRALCEPDASPFGAAPSGGAESTLGPTADGAPAVICSPRPEREGP
jgi:hypothetical protein